MCLLEFNAGYLHLAGFDTALFQILISSISGWIVDFSEAYQEFPFLASMA